MIDPQKNKVYRWERQFVAPYDINHIKFSQISSIVGYIWGQEGLEYPPIVSLHPRKNGRKSDGTRLELRFTLNSYTWIVIHELAHAMTTLCNDDSNQHGSLFMGMYCQLLNRYLYLDLTKLIESARNNGIVVKENVTPVFM
jgi:hypothetical protein